MATEEQLTYNTGWTMYNGEYYKNAQRLTIPNRRVTKLGFWLSKNGSAPAEPVTFGIEGLGEVVLVSKVLGNGSDIAAGITYYEVEFDTPVTIDEEVRIYASFNYGTAANSIDIYNQDSDVKADEFWSRYKSSWSDQVTYDLAYIYTYEEAAGLENKSANMGAKMIAGRLI